MEEIIYSEIPKLHNPDFVIGFEGWPNAGEISSSVLHHLIETLEAKKFASIPLDGFYQVSSSRPTAVIKEGLLQELKLPGNTFYYCKRPASKDLLLFQGLEPHLHWNRFIALLFDVASKFGAGQVFTIGGTYDYVPHTQPAMVSALFTQEDLREKVLKAGLVLTEYSGPVSIHTLISQEAKTRGLKAISLWGHAPQYLQTKNIKVVCAVLKKLMRLMGREIDLYDLEKASDYFDQQVHHLMEQDPKLREVVEKLEEVYRRSDRSAKGSKEDEGSKEEKVVYIEAFLKRQEDEEKGNE
jgi:proteasome assembly chaperone (PAC2) family protein